jgi:putative chitinase
MLLKEGSEDDHVKLVQAKLGIAMDGVFGTDTTKAVKKWQAAHGLVADGKVGDATWSKMFAVITARDENGNLVDDDGDITEIESADDEVPASSISSATPVASIPGLKLEKLKGHIPDAVLAQIPDCVAKFHINTNLRLAHFLSQCAHESAGFTAIRENLNYSATGLRKTFSKIFPPANPANYERQPEKIGALVYANKMGNGNEASKEGYKYRGRGYIQLTGKSNYEDFKKFIGDDVVANPDLVATKYPLASAGYFFNNIKKTLWAACDKGATDDDVKAVTKIVNGGDNGLADRQKLFKKYHALL